MKKLLLKLAICGTVSAVIYGGVQQSKAQTPDVVSTNDTRQKSVSGFPSLQHQLSQKHHGQEVIAGSALEHLIRENQDFSILRLDEANDLRGLPPWLRVYWRKQHPEGEYTAADPTGGYPHVLKEILEWMMAHQDLKPGPGIEGKEGGDSATDVDAENAVGTDVRISGAQTSPRSESDIRINYFDTQKILGGSNNISSGGRQAMFYSTNGGTTWSQSLLPLTAPDTFHSDPTTEWTNDGRAYSSTLGIAGGSLRLRNYYSTDNGATWTLDATPSGTQTNVDKQMVWVDHSSTSPYFGRMYAIWHNGAPAIMNRRTAGAAGTWLATPLTVSTGDGASGTRIGSDVKTNSAGDVFGFYPATGNRGLYVVKSTNGGDSFGAAVQIATSYDGYDIGIPSFNNRRALIYLSGGAYKTTTKNLVYASWTDLSGDAGCTAAGNEPGSNVASTCKMRVWFARSTNGGTTWSTPAKINNQAGLNDQFNQWMAVDETTGRVGMIYYDTVGDAGRKKTDIYFQYSADDGLTWSTAEKVTSAMTDETVAGANSGNQYGDYNALSGYAGTFFPSWTDRRSNASEEIWTAKVSTPTAASVLVGGRVLQSKNRPLGKATVTLLDTATGNSRYATTNAAGYYRFSEVRAGGSYIITVTHKRFQFEPRVVSLVGEDDEINFTAVAPASKR